MKIAMKATIPPAKPANWPGIMVMTDPLFWRPFGCHFARYAAGHAKRRMLPSPPDSAVF